MRVLLVLLLVGGVFAGCLSEETPTTTDPGPKTGSDPEVFPLPEEVSDMEFVGTAHPDSTTGIWVEDGLAYLSGPAGLRIVDVADPAAPRLLSDAVDDVAGTRDVDLLHHPDGRLLAILAHGGARISVIDVTDPSRPVLVTAVTDIGAAHNIAVVPDSTVVYNSRSISGHTPTPGTTGVVDVVDLADPEAPQVSVFRFPAVAMTEGGVPKTVTATTCHDITFEPERAWALCAGVSETHVWDIEDPLAPVIVQVVPSPANNIHHGAWTARGGELLLIGDEFAGAVAGPMCSPAPNPYAALWFYDISDLATPVPLGYFQVDHDSAAAQDTRLCTTHFGTTVEDRDLFVLGWYAAGTVLIDFSDPASPVQVAHYRAEGTNTWEARYWNGHVFTGDTARGMEILRLV